MTDHDGLIEFAHEWLLEQKVATPEGDLVNGLTAICEDLRAAVAAANQRTDALVAGGNALADELNKWGWGDLHYGPTDQERSVTDAIDAWRALVADQPDPEEDT